MLQAAEQAARLAIVVFAAWAVLRLAAGEFEYRRDTPDSVRHAAMLGDTRAWQRLAELLAEPEPEAAREALREAVRSDPRAASAWISLGLAEERRGDIASARRDFEEAFRVDRQYAPAWALANFCFRRGDRDGFWRAAARAAARAPILADVSEAQASGSLTDLRPLLDLAGRMDPVPARMLDRLGPSNGVPAAFAAPLERAYLDDLIGQSRWDDAQIVARRLAARRAACDQPRLDDFVTRLIGAGRVTAAIGVWNAYSGFAALDPDRGFSLTNGDFSREPRNAGFDWRGDFQAGDAGAGGKPRDGAVDGIAHLWTPRQLEFRFTGEEAEQAQLAEQWFPLRSPLRRPPIRVRIYCLRFEYLTRDMPAPTGIRWERAPQEAAALDPSPSYWRSAQWRFAAAGERLAPLRLVYRREPGTPRARGAFLLRHVRLEAL